jgi:hypothetical protein
MLGLSSDIFWTIHRIKVTFVDCLGNEKSVTGTGFWLTSQSGKKIFVTNKHNVDPSIKFPPTPQRPTEYSLDKISIELRHYEFGQPTEKTEFFDVENRDDCLVSSLMADCAVLVEPKFYKEVPSDAIRGLLKAEHLIDEAMFSEPLIINAMETAFFVGFPGGKGLPSDNKNLDWWDETWKLPIARQCIVSSLPQIPFTNSAIKTDDVILVSGMSFSGSSGSPVFLPARDCHFGEEFHVPTRRRAKIAGIMSGHFREAQPEPPMFLHTGLSYMTRSTSILKLLQEIDV